MMNPKGLAGVQQTSTRYVSNRYDLFQKSVAGYHHASNGAIAMEKELIWLNKH